MDARRVLNAAGRWLAVAAIGAGAAGCAATSPEGPYGTEPAAVARGRTLAQQQCGSCHGLGASGESAFPGAPAFRDMRFDYNAIEYQRRMAQMHQGHVDMPPAELSRQDLGDIGAYIRSLEHAPRR